MSAMDGYAVRAADAALGARLKVIGEVAAGRPFDQAIAAGQAARIFTGGVVPDGADAIVIQEDTTQDGDTVIVNEASTPGKNIRKAGIDFNQGDVLLPRGALLNDRALALAGGNEPSAPAGASPSRASRSSPPATNWLRRAQASLPARSSSAMSSRSAPCP
jgi:molybdopterin molybdotransferase